MMNYCEEDDDGDTKLDTLSHSYWSILGEETIVEIDKRKRGEILEKTKNEMKIEIWMSSWAHWLYTPWLWATTIHLYMGSRWPKMVGHRVLIGQEISLSLSTTSLYQLKDQLCRCIVVPCLDTYLLEKTYLHLLIYSSLRGCCCKKMRVL